MSTPTTFKSHSAELAELMKKYPNNKYEFSVFNPRLSDISINPVGCRINASSVSNVGQVDIAPTMNLISDKLYTPRACKMEAGILKSNPQYKSNPLYYSIVENTPEDSSNNLFKCYTYSGNLPAAVQNPDPVRYSVNVMEQPPIWSGIIEPENIKPGNYATINVNGDLVIKNTNSSNGANVIVLKSINKITTITDNYTDCYYKNYTQEIDEWAKQNELLATCNGGKQVAHWNYVGSKLGYNPFCNVKLLLREENKTIQLILKTKGTTAETDYVLFSIPHPPDAVGNYNWYLEQKAGKTHFIDKIGNGQINLQNSLISRSCKFKLKISNEGNLVLVYCKEICITDKNPVGDIRQYSQEKDARFLNLVDVPKEFNHIYYKTIDNKMSEIPTNSKILSYNNHLYPNTPTFATYEEYVPRDLTKSTPTVSADECKKTCKDDPNCDYYYHYTQDNQQYCQTGKNTTTNIVPSGVFNSAKQYSNIPPNNSILHIRNKKVDLPADSMSRDPVIPMNYANDYATYASYPILDSKIEAFSNIPKGLKDSRNQKIMYNGVPVYNNGDVCGRRGCRKEFTSCDILDISTNSAVCRNNHNLFTIKKNHMKVERIPVPTTAAPLPRVHYNKYGTYSEPLVKDLKRKVRNMFRSKKNKRKENFNPSVCTSDTPGGCKQYISNNIQSLNNAYSGYYENSSKINSNYTDLSNNIDEYNASRAELNSDARYEFSPSAGIQQSSSNILDVVNADINEMVLHQNNMYILGTVTSASLLIAAILLSGSD